MRSALTFTFILGVAAAGCRPEPVLNPHKQPRGTKPEVTHVSQDQAPGGTVKGRDGATVDLATLWQRKRVVLVFYRGHWCPHCQHQLGELNKHRAEIEGMNAVIAAISSDEIADAEELHKKLELGFELYSDQPLAVIAKFGVEDYSAGISLPATFVVEPGGQISYRKIGEKPSDHPSMDELMAALRPRADG